jgi:PLP dependent protein
MSSIAARLGDVRARIAAAAHAAGRAPESVELVAVSKFHGPEAIREAYAAGQRVFGENYAQELAQKRAALADLPDLSFHFIGGLQRNKVKLLVPASQVIETLASAEAAGTLSKRAAELGLTVTALVQVNVSHEPQKSGVLPEQLGALLEAARALPALRVTGLMAIPEADDLERARASYATLRILAQQHGLTELSMGMSDDLELAIAEGATVVRVGTAIFGPRPAR